MQPITIDPTMDQASSCPLQHIPCMLIHSSVFWLPCLYNLLKLHLFSVVVDRIKLNFGATIITEHPFTRGAMEQLVAEARAMIQSERVLLAKGAEPEDWDAAENKAKYLRPVPKMSDKAGGDADDRGQRKREEVDSDEHLLPGLKRRSTKMANLVEAMMLNSVTNTPSSDRSEKSEKTEDDKKNGDVVVDNKANGKLAQQQSQEGGTAVGPTSRTCAIL